MKTKSIVLLSTTWGPRYGGINAFNMDLCCAFADLISPVYEVVCVVLEATRDEIEDAGRHKVKLVSLERGENHADRYDRAWAHEVWEKLSQGDSPPQVEWWIGHDVISGEAANRLPGISQSGSSAVIMHMSYRDYMGYKHAVAQKAQQKHELQEKVFQNAGKCFAVGPLLRDRLIDIVGQDKVTMLVPGLPSIEPKPVISSFSAITFGRLDPENDRIKQGQLAVAAFASACRLAHEDRSRPEILHRNPCMYLFGIEKPGDVEEQQLRQLAEEVAGRVINLLPLPYTEDRNKLFKTLAESSIALMLSWHEGFGLTGWEAIAAEVPLIISEASGLYQLINELLGGMGLGCLRPVSIQGRSGGDSEPNYTEADCQIVSEQILQCAADLEKARKNAGNLKRLLLERDCTWDSTARRLAEALGLDYSSTPAANGGNPLSAKPLAAAEPTTSVSDLLDPKQLKWPTQVEMPDSLLLRAEREIVPFHAAREDALSEVMDWAERPKPAIAIRLQIGEGGVGKTRLMIEACRRLRARGWQAGFIREGTDTTGFANLVKHYPNSLIVVDYAETRRTEVVQLIQVVASLPAGHRVRLALLARAGGDWWDKLPDRAPPMVAALLHSLSHTTGPYPILPLSLEGNNRRQIFHEACAAFQKALDQSGIVVNPPDLSPAHFGDVLFIHLAALAALRGESPEGARELLAATLKRERDYWRRALSNEGLAEDSLLEGFEQIIALITLVGGTKSAHDACKLIISAPRLRDRLSAALKDKLFDLLRRLYPLEGGIDALRPDLLGARQVAQAIEHDERIVDIVLAKEAPNNWARGALAVLTRLARRHPEDSCYLRRALESHVQYQAVHALEVAMETGDPLGRILAEILEKAPRNIWLGPVSRLRPLIPKETVALSELAVTVTDLHLKYLQQKNSKGRQAQVELAEAYFQLAVRLGNAGQPERALQPAQKALQLFETLARSGHAKDRANWATSLNNLAADLSNLGRFEEALEHARQAETLYRDLAAQRPDAFRPNWAMSLNTLANRLHYLGRFEEALEHARRAETLYRKLATQRPDAFRPNWAMSLNNLANRLSNLGRFEEALERAQQAETLYRDLAAQRPDAFRPNWAGSLNTLANCLSNLGRFEEALEQIQQAEALYRDLATQRPDVFRPNWAGSLNTLANCLSDLGRFEEALEHARQAETLYRELAAQRPEAFRPNWAGSLGNLANHLSDLGRFEEALEHAQHSEIIRRELAAQRPDAFRPDWAMSLNNLANHLSNLGRFEEALEHARQAETLYRQLAAQRPDALRPNWAGSLNNLANCLEEGGQPVEALVPAEQAADLFASLAEQYPAAYEADYAQSLANSAEILLANGRIKEALRQSEMAEHMLVPLFAKRPAIIGPTLAETLDVLARCQSAAGQTEAARTTARRAVEVLAPLFRERPRALYKGMEKRAVTLRRLAEPGIDPLPTDIAQTLQQIKAIASGA